MKRKTPPAPVKKPPKAGDWYAASKTAPLGQGDRLKVHVKRKKAGSEAAAAFVRYRDGMSIADFIRAGGTREQLAHDRAKGFITVHAPDTYARPAAAASPVALINARTASGRLRDIKRRIEAESSATG